MKTKRRIVVIVGPTASGKTGWGVEIAKKYQGEIISADSRQVYRFLDVGTGKEGQPAQCAGNPKSEFRNPKQRGSNLKIQNSKQQLNNETIEQLEKSIRYINGIPQWLIDVVEPEAKFTMFDWLERARIIIEDIFARGKTPIIVGGTGLYVQALTQGFAFNKTNNEKLITKNHNLQHKNFTREELEKKSLKQLQKIYQKLDTGYRQLDANNPHRLIRAIERTQKGEIVTKKKPDFQVLQIAIDLPREVLYQRIDQRVEEWFRQGFIEEVQNLIKSGVDTKWLLSLGLEYRIIGQFILDSNNLAIEQYNNEFERMKQELKYKIHSYARRQLTWFRRFPEIVWCRDLKSVEKEVGKFLL